MPERGISRIAIVGSGLMGQGIALEFAVGGCQVHIQDVSDVKIREALGKIRDSLEMLVRVGLLPAERVSPALLRIKACTSLEEAVSDVDLVVESVYENLELKQRIFHELDRWSPRHAILASNSSSLPPSQLARETARPDKVLVAHYFNPAYLLPLVEIVRGAETSDETVEAVCGLLRQLGKHPAIVRKEVPGFIGNRLQAALIREALSLVQNGVASAQDVDTVIRYGFGRRLAAAGVFEVFDLAGWDTVLAIARYLLPELESSTRVAPLLEQMVANGDLGVKSGRGFYSWDPERARARSQQIAQALVRIAQWSERP